MIIMKTKLTLLFALLLNLTIIAQTFISQKQSYFGDNGKIIIEGERKVIIDGGKFSMLLPNNTEFKGTLKFTSEKIVNGFNQKIYNIDGDGLIVLNEDNVFANLYATRYETAITYFLENYVELTEEEKLKEKAERDRKVAEFSLKTDIKIFGELTAKCIQDKKVRPGMKEVALVLILGQPKSINKTETMDGVTKQYVYENKYIYTENGIVTTIQSEE